MRFQYISDIHLETRNSIIKSIGLEKFVTNKLRLKKLADNLFLLGDIGDPHSQIYNDFIKYCSDNWRNVFVIYGNHEFYTSKRKRIDMNITRAKIFPDNVYFLDNNKKYIDASNNVSDTRTDSSIKILGSTLWSNISVSAQQYMNDYCKIWLNEKSLTGEMTRNMFHINKNWIFEELSEIIPTILLTHHGVNNICNGPYIGGELESAFATDIDFSNYPHLKVCINGHTHVSLNTFIPNTTIKLLANCYGYPGEDIGIVKYKPDSVYQLVV